jgi:glycosyltransferase involved in cell wall biosynthesis
MVTAMNPPTVWPESGRPARDQIRIVHLITGLGSGGAEMMLYKLLASLDKSRFSSQVVPMTEGGLFAGRIAELGVRVTSLRMDHGSANPIAGFRLVSLLREVRPTILQTWMYHADLLGLVAGRLARVPKIVWNIRASDLDLDGTHRTLRKIFKVHGLLSPFPDVAIINSASGLTFHKNRAHHPTRWELIQNGFDLDRFRFDPEIRDRVRNELKLGPDTVAVGMIARFTRMKDHQTFFRAARILLDSVPRAVFVLAGRGVTADNPEIAAHLRELDLAKHTRLLGERADTALLLPGLDIVTLCSTSGEGFPNTLGEAMCCEVPCVATDIGDSALLLGDTGKIVRPRDRDAFVRCWKELTDLGPEGRRQLGMAARRRVAGHFAISDVVKRYETLYEGLAACVG